MTDSGGLAVAEDAKHFSHLARIDLSDNHFTASMVDRLRNALGERGELGGQTLVYLDDDSDEGDGVDDS